MRVAILGSTGSVGRNTLEVIRHLKGYCHIHALGTHSNWELLGEQIQEFKPKVVVLHARQAWDALRLNLRDGPRVLLGIEGIREIVSDQEIELVVVAISGAGGLLASFYTLSAGKRLALANKESLVMCGHLLIREAKLKRTKILPIDSEHSAIFQILDGRDEGVRRVFLTASGGPFLKLGSESLANVTPEEALNHPVWQMGKRITVDSATMVNKALEIIEAKWLFGLSPSQIEVLIHPQSIVHSMVEFCDGTIFAHMGYPDMKIPIQYALTYPNRVDAYSRGIDFASLGSLSFEPSDPDRFPALRIGYHVADVGGTAGAILNATNEVAVEAFLAKQIRFTDITRIIQEIIEVHKVIPNPSLEEVLQADNWARGLAREKIASLR
jgi:1-deoxy-D-xylulose-5-phosphate reductoisomerase